jgi:hypothetical protein
MSKSLTKTVRILKPARVKTDDRGRTVWDGPVEETELELVSTAMLRTMLASGDGERRRQLKKAAAGKEGVLAKNLTSGTFEIIDDDDLKAALEHSDATPGRTRAADVTWQPLRQRADTANEELSLVSTQALRKILGQPEKKKEPARKETGKKDRKKDVLPGGGFDPYNSG